MEALGLILARGGSKAIPKKNLADLGGKPLIAWTIQAALASNLSRVIVSTDDEEIAAVSRDYGAGVPFMRPSHLATDTARSIDVEEHALRALAIQGYSPDVFFRLQPTSPLRSTTDINTALQSAEIAARHGCTVVGVSPARDTPSLVYPLRVSSRPKVDERARQDQGEFVRVNGAVYVGSPVDWRRYGWYKNMIPYHMPWERAWDIDTPFDLEVARALVETGRVR